jgi:hypothetical protein
MPQTAGQRPTPRRTLRPALVPLTIAVVAILGALVYQSGSSAASVRETAAPVRTQEAVRPSPRAPSLGELPPLDAAIGAGGGDGRLTSDDGLLPDGVTALDDEHPGIANLDPDLRAALSRATRDASRTGVRLLVTSGWRSTAYQRVLLREAISEHGSEREAARWVATEDTSPHVSGDAVDIGSDAAIDWLVRQGAAYGLCRIYRNEPWHYELRPEATDGGCPPMYADPTADPRMRG